MATLHCAELEGARSGAKALSWQCLTLRSTRAPGERVPTLTPACSPAPEGCLDPAEQKTAF